MLGFFWRMIVGHFYSCQHEWETIDRSNESLHDRIIARVWFLRCKKCGDMKNHRSDD